MPDPIVIASSSRQEDAALRALADVSLAVRSWAHCRVVGGHMVTVHLALSGADITHRPTADADLAVPSALLAQDEFADRLIRRLGYTKTDGSRLTRDTEYGPASIDLVAPAPASRALHNRRVGRFSVDQFPGLQYALDEPPVAVDLEAVPLEGDAFGTSRIAVPTLAAAIVVKAISARSRRKDTEDLLLLLHAADAQGLELPAPPYHNADVGTAAAYLQGPFLRNAPQEVRARIDRIIPRPPSRPAFPNL